ncbi:MAG: amino acid ABC transporter permease [Oscillospiraceae bacterium]|nr:amino acid ABC transporter permease [Oscillospiraceae bacterium]
MRKAAVVIAAVLIMLAVSSCASGSLSGLYEEDVLRPARVKLDFSGDSVTLTSLKGDLLTGTFTASGDVVEITFPPAEAHALGLRQVMNGLRSGDKIIFEDYTFLRMPSALEKIISWMPALLNASWITLSLTVLSVCAALILSVFLALGKLSKNFITRNLSNAYVFFFRGTPLLMQIFFIYYGLPLIHSALTIQSRYMAAFIAFTLNIAAYVAEIIRAAIQSIDKGQMEASKALGLSYAQAMRLVIIPQAYRRMIPPICNEFVMVLKDTSLVFVIGLMDLTSQTRKIQSSNNTTLVFIPAMALYLVMTSVFTSVFNRLEERLSRYE